MKRKKVAIFAMMWFLTAKELAGPEHYLEAIFLTELPLLHWKVIELILMYDSVAYHVEVYFLAMRLALYLIAFPMQAN
jgi:hypothetical protein